MILIIDIEITNQPPPPPFKHELTRYNNYEGYKVEEADQDEDWGGVREGWRSGGEDRGGNNQLNEGKVCGLFPGCDMEGELFGSILIW